MKVENEASNEILQLLKLRKDAVSKILASVIRQIDCFDEKKMDEEVFEQQQSIIDEYIEKINAWNDRFDAICLSAQEQLRQLIQADEEIAKEIRLATQELDRVAMELKSEEACLRELFEQYIAGEYKKINERNELRKKASVYYKTMTGLVDQKSYFYDNKN